MKTDTQNTRGNCNSGKIHLHWHQYVLKISHIQWETEQKVSLGTWLKIWDQPNEQKPMGSRSKLDHNQKSSRAADPDTWLEREMRSETSFLEWLGLPKHLMATKHLLVGWNGCANASVEMKNPLLDLNRTKALQSVASLAAVFHHSAYPWLELAAVHESMN